MSDANRQAGREPAATPEGPARPPAGGSPQLAAGNTSGFREFLAFLRQRPAFLFGYVIVASVALLGLISPWIVPYNPENALPNAFLKPPGAQYFFGTDSAALDIFSRVLAAPRIDLAIAVTATLAAALIGSLLGAFVGLWEGRRAPRGWASTLVIRTADVLQAFPVFALALVLVAVLGQGVRALVIAIAVVNVPLYLRLMRAEVLAIRTMPFIEAAKVAGGGDVYLLRRHIVPNALAPVVAQMSVNVGAAILLTAGLSFIGAGVAAPRPEWGSMIAMGFPNVMTGQWWPSLFPGIALAVTVLGFSLIGSSIEAYSNPRERTRPPLRAWRAYVRGTRRTRLADAGKAA